MVGTIYTIKKDIIDGLPKTPYRNGVGAYEGVVAHSTATPEATAQREVQYFKDNWKTRQAFPHFFVDWNEIIQIADIDYKCWASGNGNPRFAQVELCETKDHVKFVESYRRYCWLMAHLLKYKNLGVIDGRTIVSHDWVSRNLGGTDHTDPISYLASHGIGWGVFVQDVLQEYQYKPPTTEPICKYTVKKGDTLTLIALKHNTTVERILKINPNITKPNLININQVIKVPNN